MSKGGYTAIAERIFERSKSGCIAGMSHVKGIRKGTDLACGIQHEGHAISAILAQQSNCPNLLFHISVIPAMNLECTKYQVQQSLSSMTAMGAAVKPSDGTTILLTALRRIAMVVVANVDTSTKVAQCGDTQFGEFSVANPVMIKSVRCFQFTGIHCRILLRTILPLQRRCFVPAEKGQQPGVRYEQQTSDALT